MGHQMTIVNEVRRDRKLSPPSNLDAFDHRPPGNSCPSFHSHHEVIRTIDTNWFQCAHELLWVSHAARTVERPATFRHAVPVISWAGLPARLLRRRHFASVLVMQSMIVLRA